MRVGLVESPCLDQRAEIRLLDRGILRIRGDSASECVESGAAISRGAFDGSDASVHHAVVWVHGRGARKICEIAFAGAEGEMKLIGAAP